LFDKLAEETEELREELASDAQSERVEQELGDLLFTAVNLARHLRVDPESALRGTNAKFRQRFAAMEQEAGGHVQMESMSAEDLEGLWTRAKQSTSEEKRGSARKNTRRGPPLQSTYARSRSYPSLISALRSKPRSGATTRATSFPGGCFCWPRVL